MERVDKLAAVATWLKENMPVNENVTLNFLPRKKMQQILKDKTSIVKDKARINIKWREDLSNRLRITDEDVLRFTNTIIEMIEQELALGGTVRLSNFGDFKTAAAEGGRRIQFIGDEKWLRTINEPLFTNEIGLKIKLEKNTLIRR